MDSLLKDIMRSFLGIFPQEPPRNDFRNPIWGDDDEDEDELYDRSPISHHDDITEELNKSMEEMISSFEGIFSDGRPFRGAEQFNFNMTSKPRRHQPVPDDDADPETLRAYYLKPSFHKKREEKKQDINLDGKISSEEISGILQNDTKTDLTSMNRDFLGEARSFCKTIITTRVMKPDGTIETHKIIQDGKDVTEETVITGPDSNPKGPINVAMNINPSIWNVNLDGHIEGHRIIQEGKNPNEEMVITGPKSKGPINVGMSHTPSIINSVLADIISKWKNFH